MGRDLILSVFAPVLVCDMMGVYVMDVYVMGVYVMGEVHVCEREFRWVRACFRARSRPLWELRCGCVHISYHVM